MNKKEESEYDVEEVVEEEEEHQIVEDFSKDPRAYALWLDASKIADLAIKYIISLAVPGAHIYDICILGDNFIKK